MSKQLNEILDLEITVVDSQGNVQNKKEKIRDILKDDITNVDFNNLVRKYTVDLFNPEQAPGISIIILSLNVDIAQAELNRVNVNLSYLQSVKSIFETSRLDPTNPDRLKTLLSQAQQIIHTSRFNLNDSVLTTLNNLRTQSNKETAMRNVFRALGLYSIVYLNESFTLSKELELARLDHEYSIELSEVNAQEHEALISRGLQGLVAYHESGIKPETVANFIRALQAVGLGIIAGGVWD